MISAIRLSLSMHLKWWWLERRWGRRFIDTILVTLEVLRKFIWGIFCRKTLLKPLEEQWRAWCLKTISAWTSLTSTYLCMQDPTTTTSHKSCLNSYRGNQKTLMIALILDAWIRRIWYQSSILTLMSLQKNSRMSKEITIPNFWLPFIKSIKRTLLAENKSDYPRMFKILTRSSRNSESTSHDHSSLNR